MAGLGELGALVVEVRATRTVTIDRHLGRALQQLCLDSIAKVDAALARQLHEGHQIRPYTVSGLFALGGVRPLLGNVAGGTRAWLRVTALSEGVLAALDTFFSTSPASLEIDRVPWAVERATWEDHPWAGRSSYSAMMHAHMSAPPPRQLRLQFASPTGFHSNGASLPLPLPRLVIGSLEQRWTAMTGAAMPELLVPFSEHLIDLAHCEIGTHAVALKNGGAEIGFVGDVLFAPAHTNATLSKNQPELAQKLALSRHELSRACGMLSAFAFFSGVGIKTAVGMGMVRTVSAS